MQSDEQAIRSLIADWGVAAASGELDRLRRLMSEDVVFLTAGQEPICGRQAFMQAFEESLKHFRITLQSKIRELHVIDGFAYCWTYLSVTTTPLHEGLPVHRSGNTLSILRRQADGSWVIVRDANMLTPKPVTISS